MLLDIQVTVFSLLITVISMLIRSYVNLYLLLVHVDSSMRNERLSFLHIS